MALLKLTALATRISGKIGGCVFGHSSNGNYVKINSFNKKLGSEAQSLQRTRLYPFTQEWRKTTPSQKNTWDQEVINYPYYNRVNETVYYSGYQLFNYLNSNRQIVGLPVVLDVPVFTPPTRADFKSFAASVFGVTASIENGVSGEIAKFYCSAPLPAGVTAQKSDMRFIGNYSIYNALSLFNLTPKYNSVFATPLAGQTVYGYYIMVSNVSGQTAADSVVKFSTA